MISAAASPPSHLGLGAPPSISEAPCRSSGNFAVRRFRLREILGISVEDLRVHWWGNPRAPRSHDVGDDDDTDREARKDGPARKDGVSELRTYPSVGREGHQEGQPDWRGRSWRVWRARARGQPAAARSATSNRCRT